MECNAVCSFLVRQGVAVDEMESTGGAQEHLANRVLGLLGFTSLLNTYEGG